METVDNNATKIMMCTTELQKQMQSMTLGVVSTEQTKYIESLLSSHWASLIYGDCGGMQSYKLIGRTENMEWAPPVLYFDIERHGGTVKGSAYAEVQSWAINIETGFAKLGQVRCRLARARDKSLNLQLLADELCRLIIGRSSDDRLVWKTNTCVKVARRCDSWVRTRVEVAACP